MVDQPSDGRILLSALPPSAGQRRIAIFTSLVLLVGFLATLPFAQIPWFRFPGFILVQQSLLMANDLITATVLFGQYRVGNSRTLSILAGGYVFTGLIVIPHALTFPGAFSATGLLAAGPQSAAWLYIGWHVVLPLTIIVFALRPGDACEEPGPYRGTWAAIVSASLAAGGAAVAMTLLATGGHDWLPELVENGQFTPAARIAVGVVLMLPLGALLMLATKRSRSMLDLWLMVVMFAWLCTIALGAFVSGGRFDIAWYVGRIFDWLTSLFILLILFSESIALYERGVRAAAIERLERERRLKEMEAILIHLSRISELGQNVSSLIHEVNQPLAAIANYLSAGLRIVGTTSAGQLKTVLERSAEQASRASEIVRHLREFITLRDTAKRAEDVSAMLRDAVRLALIGSDGHAPRIDLQCAPAASSAVFDRVQIEQVVFNLVRNAIEAMANSDRRALTIATSLDSAGMVEVSVSDTGPGLSPAIRARLFEPFVTSKPSGLGIGLSICRVIVEAHGGRLQADDVPGGGTVFRFTLPRMSTPVSEKLEMAPS